MQKQESSRRSPLAHSHACLPVISHIYHQYIKYCDEKGTPLLSVLLSQSMNKIRHTNESVSDFLIYTQYT